jgi:hypothetical protein
MPKSAPGQTFEQAEKIRKSDGMQGELGIPVSIVCEE